MEQIDYERIRMLINNLVSEYNTRNPFSLARFLNIHIQETNVDVRCFKARVFLIDNNLGIMINKNFDTNTKKILCAHELAHALLHKEYINHFGENGISSYKCESEANYFTLELLSYQTNCDFTKYNADELQTILDINIKVKGCL